MEFTSETLPPLIRRVGQESFLLTNPGKLKIQRPGAEEPPLFFEGPEVDKKWNVYLCVRIEESDL